MKSVHSLAKSDQGGCRFKCMDFIHGWSTDEFHNVSPPGSHSPFTHKTFFAIAYFPPSSQDNLYSHLTLADPEFDGLKASTNHSIIDMRGC